jgi:hypothetical protein
MTSLCEDGDELPDLLKAGDFLVAGVIGHFLMETVRHWVIIIIIIIIIINTVTQQPSC